EAHLDRKDSGRKRASSIIRREPQRLHAAEQLIRFGKKGQGPTSQFAENLFGVATSVRARLYCFGKQIPTTFGCPILATSLFLWLGWGSTKTVFICRIYSVSKFSHQEIGIEKKDNERDLNHCPQNRNHAIAALWVSMLIIREQCNPERH